MFENKKYKENLQAVASLSNLFSKSKTPFLHYRAAENIFCRSFGLENLSRDDTSYDAKKEELGIGLKTFIVSNKNETKKEKIAEFNSLGHMLTPLISNLDLFVKTLTEMRNERIQVANRIYNIKKGIYHCVARKSECLKIFEESYIPINTIKLKNISKTKAGISFCDDKNEYYYNFSKSTLFKKFIVPQNCISIPVKILEDPYSLLLEIYQNQASIFSKNEDEYPFVILPLYSTEKQQKIVHTKSGLNQWNAGGRFRNKGEVYIPVPSIIHKINSNFFPPRDISFQLEVPTGEKLNAKLCQENSKALMTNPNNALSGWILREVLKIKEGEVLEYSKLEKIGLDSVKITKIGKNYFKINFSGLDSFENFLESEQ